MYTYKIYVCVNNQINTFETIKKWAKLNGIKIEPMLIFWASFVSCSFYT